MSAVPILLADALTAVINTAQAANELGSLSFTAVRSYPDWDDDFKDLKSLEVDIVPVTSAGDLVELDTERTINSEPAVDICIRRRFEPGDRTTSGAKDGRLKKNAVDPLVLLVEKIHELLSGDRFTAVTLSGSIVANWVDATVRTYCDYKRLREGCFLGVVRVRYNVSKAAN
jgi:hypothetical protein